MAFWPWLPNLILPPSPLGCSYIALIAAHYPFASMLSGCSLN